MQTASIDKFYLDLTGTERLFGESLEVTAHRIRETVLEATRISVSIGGGTRRMISKLASGRVKPKGIQIGPAGHATEFMKRLDHTKIPRVGPALVEVLETDGATYRIARELLTELRTRCRTPTRLLGVGLTNLGSGDDPVQCGLFEEENHLEGHRERTLGHLVDGLHERFGDHAVLPGRIIGD